MHRHRITALAAVVLATTAGGVAVTLDRTSADGPPNRVELIRKRHLPETELTDQDGRTVRFYSDLVRGKTVAISFFYTACSRTCTLSSQNISRVQDMLAESPGLDVQFYAISLDPERDTPEAVKAYRDAQKAGANWTFLTARSVADVTVLRHKLGVREPDAEADADISSHANTIVLGNEPAGRWSMVPALVNPVRIIQAIDRVRLPPDQWQRGTALIEAVPREDNDSALKR